MNEFTGCTQNILTWGFRILFFLGFRIFGVYQWIGLRENLQEAIDFPMKIMGLSCKFPLIQSIDFRVSVFYPLVICYIAIENGHL